MGFFCSTTCFYVDLKEFYVIRSIQNGWEVCGNVSNNFGLFVDNRIMKRSASVTISGNRQPLRRHQHFDLLQISVSYGLVDPLDRVLNQQTCKLSYLYISVFGNSDIFMPHAPSLSRTTLLSNIYCDIMPSWRPCKVIVGIGGQLSGRKTFFSGATNG